MESIGIIIIICLVVLIFQLSKIRKDLKVVCDWLAEIRSYELKITNNIRTLVKGFVFVIRDKKEREGYKKLSSRFEECFR
jgi:hypothetical protein